MALKPMLFVFPTTCG